MSPIGWSWGCGVSANEYRARICKPLKEPRNLFPAWRAGTQPNWRTRARICNLLRSLGIDSQPGGPVRKPYFVIPARQATKAGGINFSESIPELHKRLLTRAQPTATVHKLAESILSPAGRYENHILSYRPGRLQRLAESISLNRFLSSINVY